MAVAEVHPSAEELASFTLGTLGDEAHASVEVHLAACASCQERAAQAPGDTLIHLLRCAHARTGRRTEAATEAVVQTPGPLPAAESVTLAPAAPAEADRPRGPDTLPPGLAGHERYRVVRLVGAGGMGAVYEAEHRVMNRTVALKVIHRACTPSAAAVDRFRREVRAAARLSHPNIVSTYDAEDARETLFLVMEYVAGISLARLVKERGPLPVAEACACIRQAALGLQHAHERGMVHRDVKPDNLIRCPDGTVKVLDFGLAVLTAERGGGLTDTNVVMGTPEYMAPEQAEDARSADTRADVYSLGCTLYYLLTGSIPYPAPTSLQKVLAHRERPLPSLRQARPEVPPELARVVERLMAKRPEDRYPTPGEVAAALEPFVRPAANPSRPRRSRLAAVALAALFAGLVLAGGAVYRIQTDKGALVITAESDDVEVVIRQGGKVVRVIDTKANKEIAVALHSGTYELELQGAPEGLKLNIDKATLTRGDSVLAKIELVSKEPPAVKPAPEEIGAVRQMVGHAQRIYPIAFSPNGRLILTGAFIEENSAFPCHVQLWDTTTGQEVGRLTGQRSGICSAAFSADGKRLVAGGVWPDPTCRVWDLRSGKELRGFSHATRIPVNVYGVAIAPDGRHVFSGCGLTVRMWDVETGKELKRFGNGPGIRSLALSRDGRYLAGGGGHHDVSIRVWDVESGKEVVRFPGHPGPDGEASVAFSPDGSRILSGGYDGTVRLWDVRTGKELRRFEGNSGMVYGVSFSPDGLQALSGGMDRTVRLWDAATGKELHRFIGHTAAVMSVAFSPDGRFAVSGCYDNTARLWRLPDPPAKGKP